MAAAFDEDDPYDVLVELLDEGRRAEVVHRSEGPFDPDTERADARDAEDALRRRLADLVRDVSRSFGEPRFLGGPERPGYPAWSEALEVAVWALPDEPLAAYASVVHRAPWDPVELRLGVR